MSLLQDLTKILKEANAGYNFNDKGQLINKYYVNPEVNEDNTEYINARKDEIESVLKSPTNLDYTNSVNKYLRLLMPRYKRRVEVEDLNRNFWVISQAIAKITQYLTIGWDTHIEVVPLPSGKNYGYMKYDNFDIKSDDFLINNTINWNSSETREKWERLIFERLQYLKATYPHSDLLILPVIRYDNYYHNYYKKEVYLGVYKYTKATDTEEFLWFYTDNGNVVKPIISEITIERDRQLFHLNEDQLNLKFYWYFGYPDSSQSEIDHQKAYVTALRGIVDFENEDTINIDIEDAIGKALLNVHGTNYYKEHYIVTFTNGKYIWSLTNVEVPQNIDLGASGETSFSNATGYYLGELSSDRSILSGISNYDLKIENYNLRPISPSLYQIRYMIENSKDIGDMRGSEPVNVGSGIAKKFLTNTKVNGSDLKFYNLLKAFDESKTGEYIPYGNGKTATGYDSYISAHDGHKVLTQHGEDAAILDLEIERIKKEIDPNKNIKLHIYNHALLLQKAENGTIEGQSSELKDIITAHFVDGSPEIQRCENTKESNSYRVYEYDGYLTGNSSNTDAYTENGKEFRGRFLQKDEHGNRRPLTAIGLTPRRNNPDSAANNYFKDWKYAGTPFEMIAIDNGAIAAAPYDYKDKNESGTIPRFSNGLERYSYGAILSIPWSSSENRCYAFEYDLFENALQDSYIFWRGKFTTLKNNNTYSIGDESYGRWHKIYTNAEYYAKQQDANDMIIKITNIGVTFGPFLNTYRDKNGHIQNIIVPDDYKNGIKIVTDDEFNNFINYHTDEPYSHYFNEQSQPYHTSPFAPVYAYGWPIRSSSQIQNAWTSNMLNDFETETLTGDSAAAIRLKDKIEGYLNGVQNASVSNLSYKRMITKGNSFSKRGYSGSAFPFESGTDSTFNCNNLVAELNRVKDNSKTQDSVDLFSKLDDDVTLNEGRYLDDTQYKFYGFTTVVHTTYIKIDLKESNNCKVAVSNTKRLDIDYRPIVNDNFALRWKKDWRNEIPNTITQQDVEDLIANNYILKQSVGDFVSKETEEGVPNKVVFNFSKYPSNGTCSIKGYDPVSLYSANTGVITNVSTEDVVPGLKDLIVTVSVPASTTAYNGKTVGDYQHDVVLENNTLTEGTSVYDEDVDGNMIILQYSATDKNTGDVVISNTLYGVKVQDLQDNTKIPITVSSQDYLTKTIIINRSDNFNIEGPLIPPAINPDEENTEETNP